MVPPGQWDLYKGGTQQGQGDYPTAFLMDDAGNAYVLGRVFNAATGVDLWLGKTSGTGAGWEWQTDWKTMYPYTPIVKYDSAGNIYMAATIQQFSPITKLVIWVGKFDTTMTLLWELTKAGSGNSGDYPTDIAVDASGRLYVLGNIYNNNNDIWFGTTITGSYWNCDLTVNGTADADDYSRTFSVDASGNTYVLGQLINTGTAYDVWLAKKAPDGIDWQWAITRDGTANGNDTAQFLVVKDSDAYVLGQLDDTGTSSDIWLGKTSDGIDWQWSITHSGVGWSGDSPAALFVDDSGNAYVTGNVYNNPNYNIWLGKTTDGSTWLWDLTKGGTAGSAYCTALVVDGSGNAYVLGYAQDTGTDSDIWLGKTITGTYWNWDITKNGTADNYDYPVGLKVDNAGNAYVLGCITNSGDNQDIWLGKTTDGAAWQWDIVKAGNAHLSDGPVAWGKDNAGNIYVLGTLIETAGDCNIWFAKYNDSAPGKLVYEVTKDGPVHLYDNAVNFAVDRAGNAYVFGLLLTRERGYDIWLGQYGPNGGAPLREIIKSGEEEDNIFQLIPLQSGWLLGEIMLIA